MGTFVTLLKYRRVILIALLAMGTIFLLINHTLPVGSGNWNQKQIERIQSKKASEGFSFAVLGDNKNGYRTFNRILRDIDQNNYLFALDTGDLVYDGEKEKYRIFYNTIKGEKTPFPVAVGNHDIREGGSANYFDIFGKFYYSFSYDNSLFIVLDDSNEIGIDEAQFSWLEKELGKNFAHKFVFLHVPPFDPRPWSNHAMKDKENAKRFMSLTKKAKIDTVFASHIHGYYDLERDGIKYIITGGAGGELLTDDPNHSFYNYVKVSVTKNNVETEVIRFPSPSQNLFSRLADVLWLYVSAFGVAHRISLMLGFGLVLLLIDYYLTRFRKSQ